VYTAEGLRGAGVPRGGSGVRSGPEAEAAVRDLSGSGRRSTWINRRRRGDKRSPREWQRRTAWEAGGSLSVGEPGRVEFGGRRKKGDGRLMT
jgi:hypothetical protein